jgi:hypothetical protein
MALIGQRREKKILTKDREGKSKGYKKARKGRGRKIKLYIRLFIEFPPKLKKFSK